VELAPRRVLLDVFVSYQLTGRLIEHELADIGIPTDDYPLYTALVHHEHMTPTALARHLGLPLSTVIFRTGKLIERGDVRRVPNPLDRRSTLLALTPRGRRLVDRAHPRFGRVLERVERHLDQPLADVQRTLAELAEAISAALAEAQREALLRERRAS
jgi:DNA-binding MarR family transcriptional regulator